METSSVDEAGIERAKCMGARVLEKHGIVALEEATLSWYGIVDDIGDLRLRDESARAPTF